MFDADSEYGERPWEPGVRARTSDWSGSTLDYGVAVGLAGTGTEPTTAWFGSLASKYPFWGDPSTDDGHRYDISFTHRQATPTALSFQFRDDSYSDNTVPAGSRYRPLTVDIFRGVPGSPQRLSAEQGQGSQIELAWEARSTDLVESFRLERSTDGTSFSVLAMLDGDTTTFTDGPVDSNTRYFYRLRSEGEFGVSSWSNVAVAVAANLPPKIVQIPKQYRTIGYSGDDIETFEFPIIATDPDGSASGLTYEVLFTTQSNVTVYRPYFESVTSNILKWSPRPLRPETGFQPAEWERTSIVRVRVTDADGQAAQMSFETVFTANADTFINVAQPTATLDVTGGLHRIDLDVEASVDDPPTNDGLSYRWSVLEAPALANPLFIDATAGQAASSTALANAAGRYAFRVEVTHPTLPTAYADVVYDLDSQLTDISLAGPASRSPEQLALDGLRQEFRVAVRASFVNQFGHPFAPNSVPTWSIVNDDGSAPTPAGAVPALTPAPDGRAASLLTGTSAGLYRVRVEDGGRTTELPFRVTTETNEPPVITGLLNHFADGKLILTAVVDDPEGFESEITYTWNLVGTDGLAIPTYETTSATTQLDVSQGGTVSVEVSAYDGKPSNTYLQQIVLVPEATTIRLEPDASVGSTTAPLGITAVVLDQFGEPLVGYDATRLTWSIRSGPASAVLLEPHGAASLRRELSATSKAIYVIKVTGDPDNLTEVFATLRIIGQVAPVADITSLPGGHEPVVISSETCICGIVQDENPSDAVTYRLFLEPTDGGNDIVLLDDTIGRVGHLPNLSRSLVRLNPTSYPDGLYRLHLEAFDGTDVSKDVVPIEIRTDVKVGGLSLSFVDLTVDVPGSEPIEVRRTYDSSRAHLDEGLGLGWRLELAEARVVTDGIRNRPSLEPNEPLKEGSVVTVDVPGVGPRRFAFFAAPSNFKGTDPIASYRYRPQFVAIDGSLDRLEVPVDSDSSGRSLLHPGDDGYEQRNGNGRFVGGYGLTRSGSSSLYIYNGTYYDPTRSDAGNRYYLTTATGTRYEIEATSGKVLSRVDANGVPVAYDDLNGVELNDGLEIRTRRAGNRIVGVELRQGSGDPIREVTYRHDADLLSEATVSGASSVFSYDDNNKLETIQDGRGVDVFEATYDDDGTLSEVQDARGNASVSDNGTFTGSLGTTSTTDANGGTTEFIYDQLGGVIREIRAERDPHTGVARRYLVTVREHSYSSDVQFDPREANGTVGINRPIETTEYEPFTIDGSDPAGQRFRAKPERAVRHVLFKVTTDERPASSDPDLWRPQAVSVLAADGVSWLSTVYQPDPVNGIDFAYHPLGGVRRVVDPYGRVTVNTYDGAGNLTETTNYRGEVTRHVYTTDQPGPRSGLLERTESMNAGDVLATVTSNTYDSNGRLSTATDAAGVTTHYSYAVDGQVTKTWRTWPSGGTSANEPDNESLFDADGRSVVSVDADGNRSLTFFGPSGLVAATVEQSASTPLPNSIGDIGVAANDPVAIALHDATGRAVANLAPDGTETRTAYDAVGRAAYRSESFISSTSYDFDANNPDNDSTTLDYILTNVSPDNGTTYVVTRTLFDDLGRSVGTERYSDSRIHLARDDQHLAGNVFATNIADVELGTLISRTQTIYDGRGRSVEQINVDGLRTGTLYQFDGSARFTGPLRPNAPANWHDDARFARPLTDPAEVDAALLAYFQNAPERTETGDLAPDGRADVTSTRADIWNLNRIEIDGAVEDSTASQDTFFLRFDHPTDGSLSHTLEVDVGLTQSGTLRQRQEDVATALLVAINDADIATGFGIRAIESNKGNVIRLVPVAGVETSYLLTAWVDDGGSSIAGKPPVLRLNGSIDPIPDPDTVGIEYESAFRRSTHTVDARGNATLVVTDETPGSSRTMHADGTVTKSFTELSSQPAVLPPGLTTPPEVAVLLGLDPLSGHPDAGIASGGRHVVSVERHDPDAGETLALTHEVYDASGRLVSVWRPTLTDASTGSTLGTPQHQYAYDAVGNVTSQTDPMGRSTVFATDTRGRSAGRTLPGGSSEQTTYDTRGRVATRVAFDGVVTELVYDDETFVADVDGSAFDWPTQIELGRMVEERVFAAGATTPSLVHRYAYDALGRRTAWGRWTGDVTASSLPERVETWTYDAVTGSVLTHLQPEGLITYGYEEATGRLTSLDAPGQAADVRYGYDDRGRLAHADVHGGRVSYTHDAAGQVVLEEHPGGVTYERTFDDVGRLETLEVLDDGTLLLGQIYTYEPDGQRASVTESGPASYRRRRRRGRTTRSAD